MIRMKIWDNIPMLEILEEERDKLRNNGKRLTFDCLHLMSRGDRAYCSMDKILGQARDGSLALVSVLRGVTSSSCINCEYFTTEE